MSGTNKLVVSENALEKGSESALTQSLLNANENAKKKDKGKKKSE